MIVGRGVILGRAEFVAAIKNLPGRVVKKIMDEWTFKQAQTLSRIARASAPRDRNRRNKPASSTLWRSIKASRVRNLKKFGPSTISRAISFGASSRRRGRQTAAAAFQRKLQKRQSRKGAKAPRMGPQAPRAGHFHWVVMGTKMRKTRQGANRGAMWGQTTNPMFWQKASAQVLAIANGEVGAQLRDAYDRGIQAEIRRLKRKHI